MVADWPFLAHDFFFIFMGALAQWCSATVHSAFWVFFSLGLVTSHNQANN
jgi:hypothetical protein